MKKTILLLCFFSVLQIQSQSLKKMIITVPVTDLREQPTKVDPATTLPASPFDNPLQTSQLLLGEYIVAHQEIINEQGEAWLNVRAMQQKIFYEEEGWQGYPGWIQAEHATEVELFPVYNIVIKDLQASIIDDEQKEIYKVSIGTRLQANESEDANLYQVTLPDKTKGYVKKSDTHNICQNWDTCEQDLRRNIVQTAHKFLGMDYSWGGRSSQDDTLPISSVDCSATVHLSYLTQGLQIPRMSHEQFLAACEIEDGKDMKAGDLIFFSTIPNLKRIDLHHIDHVMLYIGDDMLLESTMAGNQNVRIISCKERLGYNIHEMVSGDVSNTIEDLFYVYFASYLHDPALVMQLRNNTIRHHAPLAHN